MNKQQIVAMTTAALAALSLAACSSETGGVPAAATTTASTTAVRPAAETATATPVPTTEEYEDVSGQGDVHMANGGQYGDPAPGILFTYTDHEEATGVGGCTLGPAVTAGARTGFITAGHCATDGEPEKYAAVGRGLSDNLLLGVADMVSADVYNDDSSVLWTSTAVGVDRIAGTWLVDGVMPLDELSGLEPGTPVCINGAVSGVKCEALIRVEDGTRIVVEPLSEHGDSGAVMFVVDIETKRATLLGITKGLVGDEGTDSVATALAPALTRIGVEAVTA